MAAIGMSRRLLVTGVARRSALNTMQTRHQTVLCVLYKGGEHAKRNPQILGAVENELGLREWLEDRGHKLIVTSDKEGQNSEFEKHLPEADVVISQPFWPAYLPRRRIEKAKNLKLALTAGVGSDHVDLDAACDHNVTVAEVTGSNVVSVAEHVVMMILSLVRNYMTGYKQVIDGEWDIAGVADRAWDLEGKHVGTVAAGRIGYRVLQRLKPFDVKLHYTDKVRLPKEVEEELGVTYHATVEEMVKVCDVVTINAPLHSETEDLFNKDLISKMKRGAYIVNTARGKIVNREAIVEACESGHIAGYAGDVWFPQPAPKDHPWRTMKNHAMTPHYSGTTLSAQARYAEGTRKILENHFDGKQQDPANLIVQNGKLASKVYSAGDSTKGSE